MACPPGAEKPPGYSNEVPPGLSCVEMRAFTKRKAGSQIMRRLSTLALSVLAVICLVGAIRFAGLLQGWQRQSKIDMALQSAVIDRDYQGIENALSAGAEADAQGSWAMWLAIFEKDPRSLKILLTAGADPNALHDLGGTPVGYAAEHNEYECVRVLLHAGADPDEADYLDRTALDRATVRSARLIRQWHTQSKPGQPQAQITRQSDR